MWDHINAKDDIVCEITVRVKIYHIEKNFVPGSVHTALICTPGISEGYIILLPLYLWKQNHKKVPWLVKFPTATKKALETQMQARFKAKL